MQLQIYPFLLIFCLEFAYSCLPTQQIEEPTTTTTTAIPTPCTACLPIYREPINMCIPGVSNCLEAATVGVTYVRGPNTVFVYGADDACSTKYTCPAGSTSQSNDVSNPGVPLMSTGQITLICREVGPNIGKWYRLEMIMPFTEVDGSTCAI